MIVNEATGNSSTDTSQLATVTVTYRPDVAILARQLQSLPRAAKKIIVDNNSGPDTTQEIRRLVDSTENAEVLFLDKNAGLAAGLNISIRKAARLEGVTHLLLLDQDTEPETGAVELLLDAFDQLDRALPNLGCVGPNLVEARHGLAHGFHLIRHGFWTRVYPVDLKTDTKPIPCHSLNGSGTLMRVALTQELGGLDEDFFIDHVDTEWGFRVLSAGFQLYGIPNVTFLHRMGDDSVRFWFLGWRTWPYRSPDRHFYLYRNAIWLMRRRYVPRVWKFWASAKLILTATMHILFDRARREQARCMFAGLRAGWRNEP